MLRSESRILCTHAGSLPRPAQLSALLVAASKGERVDPTVLATAVAAATAESIAHQREAGIDVGNDGEIPRESFFSYVRTRMSGFGGASRRPPTLDVVQYPAWTAMRQADRRERVDLWAAPAAVGPVAYVDGGAAVHAECAALGGSGFAETFFTAPSPGIVAAAMENRYYPSLAEYVAAVAAALRVEYETIVEAGHVLQIDAPDLALERQVLFGDRPLDEFLAFVDVVVAAINDALRSIPPERVRLHVCWGNYEGPHTNDVPLEAIWAHVLEARAGAIVLSMANPRHAHELRVLRAEPLPPERLLIAGVIDTTTNYVEHPEVVADRLERAAEVVGDPCRVLAGTDCGFSSSVGAPKVVDEIVWEKLRALRAGADLASARLF